MGKKHPETPARIQSIEDQLIVEDVWDLLSRHVATGATKAQMARVHSTIFIESICKQSQQAGPIYLDSDTAKNSHSVEAALHAAGATVKAVDLVMTGQAKNAFCNIRPPDHHAERNNAAGFCIFNNVAVAAEHAHEVYRLQRVSITDFDVHHGNSTDEILNHEERVLLCSTFRHPYYSYQGITSTNEHITNIPLAADSTEKKFRPALTEHWLPALEKYQPQFLLISTGFDAHREDIMGGMTLEYADYAWVTTKLLDIATLFFW